VNATVVGLSWNLPEASRSGGYEVVRDGVPLGHTNDTQFVDTTVAQSTRYTYSVHGVSRSGSLAPEATLQVDTPEPAPSGDAPYCQSKHLGSMSWDWASARTEPNGSDLWPVTWGRDGKVYTFFGDGGGFGGDNLRGRASFGVATMKGPPPPPPEGLKNIYGGLNTTHPSTLAGKAGAILAVGSDFYTLGGIYSAAELARNPNKVSGAPRRIQLAYSKGNAWSWQAAPWAFCSATDGAIQGSFCATGFVNFGRGNKGAPDGQVYLLGFANSKAYWGDGSEAGEETAATYLARVPSNQVLDLKAYNYFVGLDAGGRPLWSTEQQQMRPIFVDRNTSRSGCRGRCHMTSPIEDIVYIPGIKRYIGVAQGNYVSQTSFYDAPHPWGPWTTIAYNNIDPASGTGGWARLGVKGGEGLGVHIVNAWTSKDGLTLWMTYSSDGKAPSGALFPPEGTQMDSFNLVSVRLIPGAALRGPH
jgi:hypothetical protein